MIVLEKKAVQRVDFLLKIISTSTQKKELVDALKEVYCIVFGSCVDLKGVDLVYEWSRCMLSSRDMQKIKEAHCDTSRWVYVKPLYAALYTDLYRDLDPETGRISNGELEDIKPCRNV
jgi:hypothetical protein